MFGGVGLCAVACAGGACARRAPDPVPPVTSVIPPESAGSPIALESASPGSANAAGAADGNDAGDSLEIERRAILDELVAVDTSHGHETDALRPIAARLEHAGVHADIFESAPGRGNLVARVRGDGSKKPILLLAHVDVVPVDGQPWTVPPFATTQREGYLWGRGVADDKGMASASVAILLELARARAKATAGGSTPPPPLARDVIVALTAGEETDGNGVRFLIAQHRGAIDAEIALNEGGGPTSTDDQARVVGMGVGVSEKVYQSFTLTVRGPGGHSSVPPREDAVATLARALVRVGEARQPARVLPDVKDLLAFLAADAQEPLAGAMRRAARSAPRISPSDEAILSSDDEANALVRTTCVTTMLAGSPQDNVLPTTATATVNCRILPDDTAEATKRWLEGVVADKRVAVDCAAPPDRDASPRSPIDPRLMDAVKAAVAAHWPGAVTYPTMDTGATDSRFLRAAGIPSYGVDTAVTSRAEDAAGRTAHGPDERTPLRWLDDGVRVLRDVVVSLAR